jgi:hypothetical protein
MREKLNKVTATAAEIERILGIPRGSLANLWWQRKGPNFSRAGQRWVLYRLADVGEWICKNPVLTKHSFDESA